LKKREVGSDTRERMVPRRGKLNAGVHLKDEKLEGY